MARAVLVRSRLLALAAAASLVIGLAPLGTATVAHAVPLPAPTLASPGEGDSVSGNPVLGWSSVSGAVSYRVELSLEPGFSSQVSGFPLTTQELRYAPPTELPAGLLYWRVSALDVSNAVGASASGSFEKGWAAAPTPLTPADDATLRFPTEPALFSWDPLAGAASYTLEIDDADDFIGAKSFSTKNTAYVLTEPVTVGQTFHWRVRGVSGTVLSNWSDPRTFRSAWPDVPALVSPASNATGITDVEFDWDPVPGAKTYELQVSPNQDFANNITIDVVVKSTRYAPPEPLNNGNYYWRVRALDAASTSNFGPWSASDRVFTRGWPDTPTILWPKNGISTADVDEDDPTWQNPTFRWTPARNASWYRIRFATAPGASTNVQGCITNRTTWTYSVLVSGVNVTNPGNCSVALVAGTTYYWDVAALDNPVKNQGVDIWGPPDQPASVIGLRSPVESFVYEPPTPTAEDSRQLTASDYLTPAACDPATCDDAEGDTPVFTWTRIPGATEYTVTVSLDKDFTNVYRVYRTPFNRLAPRDSWRDNQANQAYYWNVRPSDLTLDTDNYSVFQKRTKAVRLRGPVADPDTGDVPKQADDVTFSWDDYLDTNQAQVPAVDQEAKQYRFESSTVSDFSTSIESKTVNTTTYTPWDKTYAEGPVYWRVQAVDGSGNELTRSTTGLVTKQSPTPTLTYPGDGDLATGVPYLQWAPLDFAASYDVQLDNDANFSSTISSITTKTAAWAYSDPLAAGTYFWRVRRNDADNRDGAWSDARSFVLQPPPVTLMSPDNASGPATSTLVLQWQPVQPSPKYRVEVSTSASFTTQLGGYPQDTVMSAWAPKTLLANGTYYWRVKTLNASNTVIATSSPRSFVIDSVRPSVIGRAPATGAAMTREFTVTFSEPVKDVDETTFTLVPTGTSTPLPGKVSMPSPTSATFSSDAPLVPGQSYIVSVSPAVVDNSGNQLVPYTTTVRASTTVQENSPTVSRTWARWSTASASGGAMKLSQRAGTTLTVPFTGTTATLLGYQGTSGGYAAISVDGVAQPGVASFYATTGRYQAEIWSATSLADGDHTLTIRVLGTKPTASKGTWVYVDGVLGDGPVTEEGGTGVADGFARVATSKASGSAYDVTDYRTATGRTAPVLTFPFTGTGISWYGTKGTRYGKAAVYIDGSKKATIDLYASSTRYRQKLWSSTTLSNKLHVIKVVPTGSKRSSAKGYDVSFDYFSIR